MVRSDDVGGPFIALSMSRRRALLARAVALSASALTSPWSAALEGGSGPIEAQADTPMAAVGSLFAGQRLLSGVVIHRLWVLTAAHAVNGAVPAEVVFRSGAGGGFNSRASAVYVHPDFVTGKVDLALVRLENPVPRHIPPARLYAGPLLGHTLQLVSHGGSTTLITRGENRADAVVPDAAGQALHYLFDFDGPDLGSNVLGPKVPAMGTLGADREATLVSGDSGSAAFVVIDGQWYLGGINTFQATVTPPDGGPPGRVAGGMVIAPRMPWMAEVMQRDAEARRQPRPAGS